MDADAAITLGSYPDWGMLLVAVAAAAIGLRQVRAAITSNGVARDAARTQARTSADAARDQLKIAADAATLQAEVARATLILEIDRDFESDEMQECRLALRALHNELKAYSIKQQPNCSNETRETHINALFGEYLNKLWADFKQSDREVDEKSIVELVNLHMKKADANPAVIQPHERAGAHYQRLTRIFGWMERVAFMVHRKLLPKDDIVKLYDAVFVQIVGWVFEHIRTRRDDSGNKEYMIETTLLRDMILQERADRKKEEEAKLLSSGKGIY